MAYLKRLKNNELIGGTDNTDVYPYTTAEAVYDKSKVTQQVINDRLLTKVSLLEESTNSLVHLKELIEEFLGEGDYSSGVLSDNNFTDALKAKLEGLENYNDSELRGLLNNVNAALDAKANKSTTYTKAEVDAKIANIDISSQISNFATDEELANGLATKQNTIANLQQIEDGAALGATAYQKPETGIPAADLAAGIQSSLNKADTALQSYTESDPTVPSHVKAITTTDISNWNGKQNALTFDSTPTAGSNNPVTSAGIKAYVDNATPTITMDDTPTSGSNNPVKSSGIYNALQGKQNTLTFDSTPTASSTNPVTSGGVKTALDLKANQSTTYTKTEVDALFDNVAYLGDDDGQATTLPFDPQADTVWNKAQTLGSAQQAQARNNIGAVGSVTVNGTTYTPTNGNVDLGTIGGSSGDVNVIETVKVNGTALIPDANKAVDVSVPTNVSDLTNDAGYTTETSVINHGTSDTTFSLTPNVLHIWGTVTSLTLTLATPADSTIVNEYMFQFTSGSTATTLSLPSSVVWDEDKGALTVESGYIYQVSILNNIALWARVAA